MFPGGYYVGLRPTYFKNDEFKMSVSTVVDIVIGKGLFVIFVLVFFVFIGLSFAWIGILENYNGSNVLSGDLAIILDSVGSIFIFIYISLWLNDSIHGYSEGPKRMRELMYQIYYLSHQSAGFYKDNGGKEAKTMNELYHIRQYGLLLLMCVYRLFIPVRIHGDQIESRYIAAFDELKSIDIQDMIKKTTIILVKYRTWTHSVINRKIYSKNQLEVLENVFEQLDKFVRDMDVSINVKDANIFRYHMLFALYLYFFIWIPISIEPFVTNITFIVSYPILMFVLTGPVIYKLWLRDPFDPNRPIKYNDYRAWFCSYGDDIVNTTQ